MVIGLASSRHRWSLKEEEVTKLVEILEETSKKVFLHKKNYFLSKVRALGQASAGLALGSAFWHGSHTRFLLLAIILVQSDDNINNEMTTMTTMKIHIW